VTIKLSLNLVIFPSSTKLLVQMEWIQTVYRNTDSEQTGSLIFGIVLADVCTYIHEMPLVQS